MVLVLRSINLLYRQLMSCFRRQIHAKNATIRKARAEDRKEVLRLMQEVFYKTDPSSVYSKVAETSVSPLMQEMSLEPFEEGLTYVANVDDSEKIVGAAINSVRPAILHPNFMESLLSKVESRSEKTLLELWKFIALMPPDSEKYFQGKDPPLFEIRYLVVDPEFRNRGIGKGLVSTSLKEAHEKKVKFTRIDCTSHFTARIASAAGMDRIYEINYKDYESPDGKHIFQNVTPPHIKIEVYARKNS